MIDSLSTKMHRLDVNLRDFDREVDKLSDLERNLLNLAAQYQKLVAEIVLLRLFYVLENTFASMACKVVCRAKYLDGSSPTVLVTCRNVQRALAEMKNYGRTRPRHTLKWTKASEIKENLKYVLNSSDHFVRVVDYHGNFIDEMRRIRNRIVHNNQQSRNNYQVVIRRLYGAKLNGITPGTLLLSKRYSPSLLRQYLIKSNILIKEVAKR